MKRNLLTVTSLLAAALLLALGAGGCSKRYKIQIESDTCWDGVIDDGQAIYDCGNATYKVIGTMKCVRVEKKTNAGYLRVRIDGGAWGETTAPLGVVQVCR